MATATRGQLRTVLAWQADFTVPDRRHGKGCGDAKRQLMILPSQSGAPRALLTIAGTDPCGAAGIQVDLQVFRDFGFHGLSVISAVVAQNTDGVRSYEAVSSLLLEAQLDALLEDIPIAAIKIGMLPTRESVLTVGRFLERKPSSIVVLDPIRVSGDGRRSLSTANAFAALIEVLMPLVDVITPNADEAAAILGRRLTRLEDLLEAARELHERGCPGVLVKAGHLPEIARSASISDVWADSDGSVVLEPLPTVDADVRGTGCQLSSAILCGRAMGLPPKEAVEQARCYLNAMLRTSTARPGRGRPLIVRHRATSAAPGGQTESNS
jgi:hydroxymethylpyrimidine/phosphomethylpyrimidine kinase